MRISDWSSDVCSSDLVIRGPRVIHRSPRYYSPRPVVVHRGPPRWSRGHRYYRAGYGRTYVVNDYYSYGLRRPPSGYYWRRSDAGDYLLVAIATGIIADLILSHRSGAGLDRTEGAPTGAPFFVGAAMPRPDTGTRPPETAAPAGARATIDAIPAPSRR